MNWRIIKRLYAMLMIASLLLLFGCNSVVETPNEQIASEYVENISAAEVFSEEDIIESESEEIQEESNVSENEMIENMEGSESEEVEDVEVIKEKALVAYQEYIDSNEMLEYATPTGEPDRRYLTKYLIWDINGDEIPELHLNNSREYFIYEYSVEEDKAVLWKTFYPNLNLRQDNVLIYQWGDSTPEGWEIIFQCFTLDQNGDKEEIAYLKMCDANNDGKYDETDIYALDSQMDCTFGEWKSVAEQYLEFNADGIIVEKELQYLDLVEWIVYCEAK